MSQIYKSLASGPVPPAIPTSFVTDDGTVIAAANVVNVNGGAGVKVIANPDLSNNMVINVTQVAPSYTNVTPSMSPYNVTADDYFVSCDTTADGGGAIVVRLPNAPTTYDQFIVKDRTAGIVTDPTWTVTVTTVGGLVTIDGSTSNVYTDAYEALELLFNGTSYESF